MSELNGKGPANNDVEQGRGLGLCTRKSTQAEFDYGTGMGKRRQVCLNRIDKKLNIDKNENCSTYKRTKQD